MTNSDKQCNATLYKNKNYSILSSNTKRKGHVLIY